MFNNVSSVPLFWFSYLWTSLRFACISLRPLLHCLLLQYETVPQNVFAPQKKKSNPKLEEQHD